LRDLPSSTPRRSADLATWPETHCRRSTHRSEPTPSPGSTRPRPWLAALLKRASGRGLLRVISSHGGGKTYVSSSDVWDIWLPIQHPMGGVPCHSASRVETA